MGGVSTVGLFAATGPANSLIDAENILGLGLVGVAYGITSLPLHPSLPLSPPPVSCTDSIPFHR